MKERMPEKMKSPERAELEQLEKTGLYVFHGSDSPNIAELEPRQGYTIPEGQDELVKDGSPAVAASPYADVAIFRALVRRGRSRFGFEDNNDFLSFKADNRGLEDAKSRTGYVYVLAKDGFTPKSGNTKGMDWRNESPVQPIKVIKVTFKDLPKNIEKFVTT